MKRYALILTNLHEGSKPILSLAYHYRVARALAVLFYAETYRLTCMASRRHIETHIRSISV